MEDVLHLYTQAYDPQYPVVCLDELPYALVADKRPSVLPQPGQVAKEDYEYERRGSCSLFMVYEPLRGWRQVAVRAQRTGEDMAYCLQQLVEVYYPQAMKIRLVTDNLNTHRTSVLYNTFPADVAGAIAAKIEWHYTPVHGSWLNMVEGELSVISRQCLRRRLADIDSVQREGQTWATARNAAQVKTAWQFSVHDARRKLRKLYPKPIEEKVS